MKLICKNSVRFSPGPSPTTFMRVARKRGRLRTGTSGVSRRSCYTRSITNFALTQTAATEIRDPNCVFLPGSTEQVAEAVTQFVTNECRFSIKGGGHSAIPQAANIDDGILMPMRRFNAVDIDFEGGSARIGAGVLMGDVYRTLDPHNLTAMVGRYEKVGMGLSVAAGVSFLMNQEGLAIDNVLNYEVVLADGSVVNANAGSHPDLFRALKGGNNNFGVVTHVTLATVETDGEIYGGVVYYPESSLPQLGEQIYDYHVRQAVDDTLTHVLPQYGYNGTTNEAIGICPVIYNKAVDELPDIMKGWVETPFTESTLQKRPYYNLSFELHDGFPDRQVLVISPIILNRNLAVL